MNTIKTSYSIKEACEELELSEVYVRRMIQKGKIKTTKVEIKKNTFKHFIAVEELEAWRSRVGNRSNRTDNRNKFNLYATPAEMEEIKRLLEANEIEAVVARSNKVKQIAE